MVNARVKTNLSESQKQEIFDAVMRALDHLNRQIQSAEAHASSDDPQTALNGIQSQTEIFKRGVSLFHGYSQPRYLNSAARRDIVLLEASRISRETGTDNKSVCRLLTQCMSAYLNDGLSGDRTKFCDV